MKKKLNVESIQSELRGGSAFFPGYKGSDSPTPQKVEAGQTEKLETSHKESVAGAVCSHGGFMKIG